MARKDWYYVHLHVKQADALDKILEKDGMKYGIADKVQLVRMLVSDFIARYEDTKSIPKARGIIPCLV